ncbi:cytochrome c oxidase accessory protein CcoG [Lacibacterium aquatile]|uniref:Cytochrome c oxidase accessory protein CcoG n=1 Tax=Lacibacterium aquatile TaxID=1168082 RepID=A0ABW5DV51_9PROT
MFANYASRVQIYPKAVSGPFRRVKWAVLAFCLAVYYGLPWLRWDRGPHRPTQAFLIDMEAYRAYFLDLEIWPQEIIYLTGLLILAAVALFFVTSLFGRIWCGYACPQTVWTDLFMAVERWIEGDRAERMRRDAAPMSAAKALRKSAKHLAWLIIAGATGGAWILYFYDAPTVTKQLFLGELSFGVYFFFALFTATTYLLAGWAREQVCTYMCPWPRFQSAMLDEQTITVTYQAYRGETRGPHKKDTSWEGRGDCIDCKQCVAACPTGIDIRDGLQLECINCGLCVDACDDIMQRVGRPERLITWDSVAGQLEKSLGRTPKRKWMRLRSMLYLGLMGALGLLMILGIATRADVELTVLRDRAPLFVPLSDGSIRNGYTLKIVSKLHEDELVNLKVEGMQDLTLMPSVHDEAIDPNAVLIRAGQVTSLRLFLKAPPSALEGENTPISVMLRTRDGKLLADTSSSFLGPHR